MNAPALPPPAWAPRVADAAIFAALVLVPLAFDPALREFGIFKSIVGSALVGVGALALALARTPLPRTALWAALPVLHVVAVLAWRPGFDAAQQAIALVTPATMVVLCLARVPHWPRRRLAWAIGLPLVIDLAWSLLQVADLAVLPATRAAFGTTHGLAVGGVGNPNENCWYLLVAATLWLGTGARARATIAVLVAALLLVLLVDRPRAAVLAAGVSAVAWAATTARARFAVPATIVLALALLGAGLCWHLETALAGRVYLARIELGMLLDSHGAAAGLGSFAHQFPAAQAQWLAGHPEQQRFFSRLDHAHLDALELVFELGALALVWIGALAWRATRGGPGEDPLRRAAWFALVQLAVLSLLGYPLFSPAVAVVGALALASRIASPMAKTPAPWLGRVSLGVLGLLLLVSAVRRDRAERSVTRALQAAHDGDPVAAALHVRDVARSWPAALSFVDRDDGVD